MGKVNREAPGSSLLSPGTCPSRCVIRTHESSLALIASKDPEDAQKLILSFLLSRQFRQRQLSREASKRS